MEFARNIYNKLPLDTRNNLFWLLYGPLPLDETGSRVYKKRLQGFPTYKSPVLNQTDQIDLGELGLKLQKPNGTRSVDAGGIISSGSDFLGSAINSYMYNTRASDMLQDAGTTNAYQNGVGYTRRNSIDSDQYSKDLHRTNTTNMIKTTASGAMLGTLIAPGWGTAIGALVGFGVGGIGSLIRSGKYRRELKEAENQVLRSNVLASNRANAIGMNNDWNNKHMNTYNLYLHGWNGIDPRYDSGHFSLLAPGELKIDAVGDAEEIKGGIKGQDSVLKYTAQTDGVLYPKLSKTMKPVYDRQQQIKSDIAQINASINKNKGKAKEIALNVSAPVLNKKFKDLQETRNLFKAAEEFMKWQRDTDLIPRGDNPINNGVAHAWNGLDASTVVNGGAALWNLLEGINTGKLSVYKPKYDYSNHYELSALAKLNSLSPVSMNSIRRNYLDAENRAITGINRSGNLSSSQRMAGLTAIASNSQRNIYNAMAENKNTYNALASQAANAALNSGYQSAQSRATYEQYSADRYLMGQGNKYTNQGIYFGNSYKAAAQMVNDINTRRMQDYMLDIYAAEAASRGAKIRPRKKGTRV